MISKHAILQKKTQTLKFAKIVLEYNEIVSKIFVKRFEHFFSTTPDAGKVFRPIRTLKI